MAYKRQISRCILTYGGEECGKPAAIEFTLGTRAPDFRPQSPLWKQGEERLLRRPLCRKCAAIIRRDMLYAGFLEAYGPVPEDLVQHWDPPFEDEES